MAREVQFALLPQSRDGFSLKGTPSNLPTPPIPPAA